MKRMEDNMGIVDIIKEAYVMVYGIDKWNSLTDRQKHDVIMRIVKDANNRIK